LKSQRLVWVVYYYLRPFLIDIEQTGWEKFDTRDEARAFLREVKKNPRFLKADELRQYNLIQLDPL
jgi:hypothetical protein